MSRVSRNRVVKVLTIITENFLESTELNVDGGKL